MLLEIDKDITTVEQGIIGHGVNCQLLMGSGVALAIRNKWPIVYEKYRDENERGPGSLSHCHVVAINSNLYVCNLFTQIYYGRGPQASYEAIAMSFKRMLEFAMTRLDLPIYIPQIGCGLGGLFWERVKLVLESAIEELNYPLNIQVCNLE